MTMTADPQIGASLLGGVTREEVAIRQVAKAANRLRRLEQEAEGCFADFTAAQDAMKEVGLTCDIELTPGISAAYSSWKQERAAEDGRRRAREAD